jgi:hypothetical protein
MAVGRAELSARIDRLALDRETFQVEVSQLAAGLSEEDRRLLGEILLERADEEGVFADAYERRVGARGWLQRTWDRVERGERR